jgi:hypothetical protein
LPSGYGIDDKEMPEGLMPQLVYPLLQREPITASVADGRAA